MKKHHLTNINFPNYALCSHSCYKNNYGDVKLLRMNENNQLNKVFLEIKSNLGVSNWDLLQSITNLFNCVIIVGAGNHYGRTPTVTQIAYQDLNSEQFRIIRPFDYDTVSDAKFDNTKNPSWHSCYSKYFRDEISGRNVVFGSDFPNRYKVKKSFAGAFGSAIRLDYYNLIATRLLNCNNETSVNNYRSLLVSSSNNINMMSHYDQDFYYKFPELVLHTKFKDHLIKSPNLKSNIIHPLDYFYQTFDLPNVSWLNLNQDGILEENIKRGRFVSYHGNVRLSRDSLVMPGYTGPVDLETKEKAEQFINEAQVIISLGYSFSNYDYDILGLIDRSKIKRIIVFDSNEKKVCENLKSHFQKLILIPRFAFLPLILNDCMASYFFKQSLEKMQEEQQ